jgi:hypothetical protein
MHAPRDSHFSLIKRVLRYLKGTLDHGLTLHRSSSNSLVAYSDADWAGCPDTHVNLPRASACFLVRTWFLGPPNGSQRHRAQVRRRNIGRLRTCWMRQLLIELRRPQIVTS